MWCHRLTNKQKAHAIAMEGTDENKGAGEGRFLSEEVGTMGPRSFRRDWYIFFRRSSSTCRHVYFARTAFCSVLCTSYIGTASVLASLCGSCCSPHGGLAYSQLRESSRLKKRSGSKRLMFRTWDAVGGPLLLVMVTSNREGKDSQSLVLQCCNSWLLLANFAFILLRHQKYAAYVLC